MREEHATIGPGNRDKATFKDTNVNEMKAFIATLLVAGARNDSYTSTKHMFENLFAVSFYRLLFSEKRWSFILRCIRMDDRAMRTKKDRFQYARTLWEMLMANCRDNWEAGNILLFI